MSETLERKAKINQQRKEKELRERVVLAVLPALVASGNYSSSSYTVMVRFAYDIAETVVQASKQRNP